MRPNKLFSKKRFAGLMVAALTLVGIVPAASAASSSLVYLQNGKLVYEPYANQGQTNAVNTIPDFSYAGYMGGGVPIPYVPAKITINPIDGDDRLNIQNAIDYVSGLPLDANGFRGAVHLNAGTYDVIGNLSIIASGVVLRGAGQGLSGTIIKDLNTGLQSNFFYVGEVTETGVVEVTATKQNITTAYVPTGARTFNVASTAGYAVGDQIFVVRTPNDTWINDLNMAQWGWTTTEYTVQYERKIVAINGNSITIDAPIVQAMETKYGGGHIVKFNDPGRISQVGIEDIRFESTFASSTDENHGWEAIKMRYVKDSWVSGVTARYYGLSTVSLNAYATRITVQDSAYLDPKSTTEGGRRYAFNAAYPTSSSNLFQRLYTQYDRHAFVSGPRVAGPNVFLDSLSENGRDDIGPHQRYATGLLFDNIKGSEIRVQNRGGSGTGHGWAGAQTMFWNSVASSEMKVDSPLGARNWGIGSVGGTQTGAGFWESYGVPVIPRSLYLQQLQDRKGVGAVTNIAIPEQLNGTIWDKLSAWRGGSKLNQSLKVVIPGSAVTASTYQVGNIPANTVDGSLTSRWASDGDGQWIQYDLGSNKQVDLLKIAFFEGSLKTFTFDIQTSLDGVNFTTAHAGIKSAQTNALQTFELPDTSPVRYVRLVGHMNTASTWNSFNEVEIYFPPAKLAVAANAVTASTHDGNVPANTIDGSLDTRWSALGDPQWIQYDLGSNKQVAFVQMAFYNGDVRTATFDIETSTDNVNFTPVATRLQSTFNNGLLKFDFTDVGSARYVRIVGHGNSVTLWNAFTEVEIYGM
ncbi:hypothetical protein PAECIP111891_04936 [Paenibacillus allorhizoplanae]|uniref:F5/8 type C domain-containing protein n=1 Tax=Paenibacillus allorhizoplanae TaxID=2905648 RepID=A0ABM9CNT5_9BACL|nr:discoidin domain-containing protein [Paenibacillus allorhizoplanae]CAH1219604.1 hypothetical protein PAECIP111891_04936 [Paenibacillus allorhizoplanae]